MKIKKKHRRRKGETLLRVSFNKHESFDFSTALRLSDHAIDGLLSVRFKTDDRRPDVNYDISGMVSLVKFMSGWLTLSDYATLIHGLIASLESMGSSGLLTKNLLLDPKHIYLDDEHRVRFVYLPLSGLDANDRAILDLLAYIAGKARFKEMRNDHYASELLSYIKQQQVFSLVEVKSFTGMDSIVYRSPDDQIGKLFASQAQVAGRDFVSEATEAELSGDEPDVDSEGFAADS